MNGERELTLHDIDLEDYEVDSNCSDDSQDSTFSYHDEEYHVENDTSKNGLQNGNVLSFENNEDLITKVWSHARIQNILISIGIVQAILVTFFCTLYMLQDSHSPELLLTKSYVNQEFTRKYFLSVTENGEVFVKSVYGNPTMPNKLFSVYAEPSEALVYVYEYERKIHAIHRKFQKYENFDTNCKGNLLKITIKT